jgi:hypothetical protein
LTAYGVFKDTPNFSSLKFVLHPDLREYLGEADETPVDIRSVLNEYSPLFPMGLDYSLLQDLIYPELWFVNSLKFKTTRDEVYGAIAQSNGWTYNASSELFFHPDGSAILGYPIDAEESPSSLQRQRIIAGGQYTLSTMTWFDAVVNLANQKFHNGKIKLHRSYFAKTQ